MRKKTIMRSQESSFDDSKRKFKRIKQAVDSVNTTGMSRDEGDKERMHAALGSHYLRKKNKHDKIKHSK